MKVYILLLFSCLPLFSVPRLLGAENEPIKVLLDANGRPWWRDGFDEFLRKNHCDVTELKPETRITMELCKDFQFVIRPSTRTISPEEMGDYVAALKAGTRLMSLNYLESTDPLIRHLGFEFSKSWEIGGTRVRDHALAKRLSDIRGPWNSLVKVPENSVSIASVGPGNPISAVHVLGNGGVMVIGMPMFAPPDKRDETPLRILAPYLSQCIRVLATKSPAVLHEELSKAPEELLPGAPKLIKPLVQARMTQKMRVPWRFEWSPVEGAQEYELTVYGARKPMPEIHATTKESSFEGHINGGVSGQRLRNWGWSVRAKDAKGNWGDWAVGRKFELESLSGSR